ncbi:hypothetical protein HB364_13985 [Pseudoflavitalea sp. X16]|uniref:hypothetical protein n=1 Tax=Paraflavitalea devenefica TaxID=2716334 RepID=UPI001420EA3A|nr:hypothetical protein [Paraflavitalea devenefica]NII26199.1 hypothetical protein [Paraflavitalea devenefica]
MAYFKSPIFILLIVPLLCLGGYLCQKTQQARKNKAPQNIIEQVVFRCDGRGMIIGNLVSENAGCYARGRPGHRVLHFVLQADTPEVMVQLWRTEQFLYEAGMRVAMGDSIVHYDSVGVTLKCGKDTIFSRVRAVLPLNSREYLALWAKDPSYWYQSLADASQLFDFITVSLDQTGFRAHAVLDTVLHNLKKGGLPDRVYNARGFLFFLYCCLINLGIDAENFDQPIGYFRFSHPNGAILWDSTVYFQLPAEKKKRNL